MSNKYSILLTFDVEDWFQVENFKEYIPFSSWPNYELRVEKNTHCLLDLLDSQRSAASRQLSASTNSINLTDPNNSQQASSIQYPVSSIQIRATFFVLGWIAKHLPDLVREIHTRGHEVASHGYYHNLGNQQSPDALKRDLSDSKKLLEDIIGAPVYGYRAPSFSISNDILNTIADAGYLYDSSFNSFGMHGRYGHVKLSQNGKKGIALPISAIPISHSPSLQAMAGGRNPESSQGVSRKSKTQNPESKIFYELPISNIKLGSSVLPWGGGAYFRLIPFPLFKMGVRSILKNEGAYLFYMHPWEVDPEQPRVDGAPSFFRFRHYTNLDKTASKLSSFIEGFTNCQFATCRQYLEL
ncbi:MAG: DUF3473 domain-containing protein [Deltaproteobacteria bacterium]|nr:DUF3473 domain-containing protein [Deltaproteobacteria bacterium]